MRALLDVNALIALLDEEHIHHEIVLEWLNRDGILPHGFATCAITQMGCIRVMSSKGYSKPFAPHEIAAMIERLAKAGHRYLDIPPPSTGATRWKAVRSDQSTHATLLSTAVAHGCRLVTFDTGIALASVSGAKRENLMVLSA